LHKELTKQRRNYPSGTSLSMCYLSTLSTAKTIQCQWWMDGWVQSNGGDSSSSPFASQPKVGLSFLDNSPP
jgi:hypothetical protein